MTRPKFPSDEQEQFMVRMPNGMRDEIAAAAKAAGRSMNSEIVLRLRDGGGAQPTLRQWYAGQALAGLLAAGGEHPVILRVARENDVDESSPANAAQAAFEMADAMIACEAEEGGEA